jgi:hypothetical protein
MFKKMEKNIRNMKKIIAILFIILLTSCGARKVNKEKSKEQAKTETVDKSTIESKVDINVKTTTTVKVDDKNETIIEETITEPVDASKESFVIDKDGSKVVLGNVKKIVRKTIKKNNTKSEVVSDINEVKKEASKEQKNINTNTVSKKENSLKEVDKKQYNPFMLIIIGLVCLVILYCLYRFYKKMPLIPKI